MIRYSIRPEAVPDELRDIAETVRALSRRLDAVARVSPETAFRLSALPGVDLLSTELAAQIEAVADRSFAYVD